MNQPNRYKKLIVLLFGILLIFNGSDAISKSLNKERSMNILLIAVDDMGFTDLGSFGGEIRTPALDKLAESGVRMTQYYTAQTCSPTRAMLLSGTDSHLAGMGDMAEVPMPWRMGKRGYEGYLNYDVVSLATLLKENGYHTYMAGKWHLGLEENLSPAARGFEKSYAMLNACASHFGDMKESLPRANSGGKADYRENGKKLDKLPSDFFSSEFYTDKLIEYIENDRADGKPFFAYAPYPAPHWPIHVPDDWLDRYKGRYDGGYEQLREERLARIKEIGLLPSWDGKAFPRFPWVKPWGSLSASEKKWEARRMELYAAMVENLDFHINRLFEYLRKTDQFDNTLIIFMSDNGAAGDNAEFMVSIGSREFYNTFDESFENMGRINSLTYYGMAWAQVGSAPFRDVKGYMAEGGIRTPMIIRHPKMNDKLVGSISNAYCTVKDITPTLLDMAGILQPNTYRFFADTPEEMTRPVHPVQGRSILPFLKGEKSIIHPKGHLMAWEWMGRFGVRYDKWKLLKQPPPFGSGDWQLYDLTSDPVEMKDLSEKYPMVRKEILEMWNWYAEKNNIIMLPPGQKFVPPPPPQLKK